MPIRVALIGLSKSSTSSWASDAHLPYLLSQRGGERYQITGLLNSSLESGRRAIEAFGLPAHVKAYASPQDLAADEDIDLVVCSTRVDKHYDAVKPSVAAGKAVFAEWPLAENANRAQELAELAKQSSSKTFVGLQTRVAPPIVKVKELLSSGQLGEVLSSDVQAYLPMIERHSISEGLAYFFDKKIGGNWVTISSGHTLDYVHAVLGEYETSHAHAQVQRPRQNLVTKTGDRLPATSDVPDLVSVHGTLVKSSLVAKGASLVINFRYGPPFKGTAPFVWTITCEKGEIRITNQGGPHLQSASVTSDVPIEVELFDSGKIEHHGWSWEDWQESLPHRGRNLAKLYDLYAEDKLDAAGAADFGDAVVRHKELDAILYAGS